MFENQYFVQNCGTSDSYSIDLKTNTITALPSMPTRVSTTAIGYILDTVYVISAYGTVCNEAYHTVTKTWTKIAPCPVISNQYCGGVIFDKICITNYMESNLFVYDPKTNQYTAQMKVLGVNWKPAGHGYILTNQCMYQVQGNDTNNWKTIQYLNGAPSFSLHNGNSYLFKKGKYLYAIDNSYKVWQIDTELFGAKSIN